MKKTMKILLIILVVFLMLIVVGKRILFPPYDEIEVTGKYEINSEDYDDSDYEMPVLNVYSDASYSHLHEWKQYRNNMKLLASPLLSGLLDQVKSEVESEEQLKRLNTDCLDFLQRISFGE